LAMDTYLYGTARRLDGGKDGHTKRPNADILRFSEKTKNKRGDRAHWGT